MFQGMEALSDSQQALNAKFGTRASESKADSIGLLRQISDMKLEQQEIVRVLKRDAEALAETVNYTNELEGRLHGYVEQRKADFEAENNRAATEMRSILETSRRRSE